MGDVGVNERGELWRAWGLYLNRFDWSHFATLTTRRSMPEESLRNEFRRWHRALERRAQQPVTWFWAMERTCTGHAHLHALVGECGHLPSDALRDAWKCGYSKCERFERSKGAAFYLMKGVSGEHLLDYEIGRRMRHAAESTIDWQ